MNRNLSDGINYISKWDLRKVWNAFLLVLSYWIAKISGRPVHWGMPMSISLEPTTSCNLRCPECPSGLRSFSRPTGMLDQQFFNQTIDQLQGTLTYLLFYFQGEPYLHPQFLTMVHYAAKHDIYTATSTNGHYLTDEMAKKTVLSGLDRLIISIDGTTQETYEAYRIGGKLHKVIEGAKNMVKWKKKLKSSTPHLIFQFLVVKPNQHQIDDLFQLAEEIGIDEVGLKTAQIYDYKNGSSLIPTLDQYARYEKQPDGTYQIKNPLKNHCWKMWHSCVITWDGQVVPCCFDKDAQYEMGDLSKNTFEEIWFGKKYQEFRGSLLHSRSEIEICKNC